MRGVSIPLSSIPNGDNRVVIVEARDGDNRDTSNLVYFGISEPFSLRPDSEIEVLIEMTRAAEVEVEVLHAVSGLVSSRDVTLAVRTNPSATAIQVDLNAQFSNPRSYSELTPALRIDDETAEFRLDYQLPPVDGPYQIFVRASTNRGYASSTASTMVELDTQSPRVTDASIRLVPGDDNPLSNITVLGTNDSAELEFTVSEQLASTPVVRLWSGTSSVALEVEEVTTLSFRAVYRIDSADVPQGDVRIELELIDIAGNATTIEVPELTFSIDTTNPTVPNIMTPGTVIYERNPWGAPSAPRPSYFAVGAAGAVEPDATVIVTASSQEVARGRADANGAFRIPLTSDLRDLRVRTADEAGNESNEVGISEIKLLVGLGNKEPGDRSVNQHRAQKVRSVDDALWQYNVAELSGAEYDEVSTKDGSMVVAEAKQWWDQIIGPSDDRRNFPVRTLMGATYDPKRGRVLMFGGFGGSNQADTWEWDGIGWDNVTPPTGSPPIRRAAALAYDTKRGRAVLFGGVGPTGPLNDAWIWEWPWNQENGSWRLLPNRGAQTPPPLVYASMVYDSDRDVFVLHGGARQAVGSAVSDTWEYDPESATWTQRNTTCVNPMDREAGCPSSRASFSMGMAYDPVNRVVLRFGGEGTRFQPYTWWYDGSSGVWSWIDTSSTSDTPEDRVGPTMVHLPATPTEPATMLLFGGKTGIYEDDTWSWDHSTRRWTRVVTSQRPRGRLDHSMVYFPPTDEVVAFGGEIDFNEASGNAVYDNDTWVFDRTTWALTRPSRAEPGGRNGMVLTSMPNRTDLLLFSGEERFQSPDKLLDAWLFTGRVWQPLPTPSVSARSGAADAVSNDRVFVFGGEGEGNVLRSDLVAFNPVSNDWMTIAPTTPAGPTPRMDSGMVFVPSGSSAPGKLIVFGGKVGTTAVSDETWVFALDDQGSGTWRQVSGGAPPSARRGMALGYDPRANQVVLFGGCTAPDTMRECPLGQALDDTWTFDPTQETWTEVSPATRPPSRFWSQLVFDQQRERLVFYGGTMGVFTGGAQNDSWEWDADTQRWHRVAANPPPIGKEYHGLAYGGRDDAVIAFAGRGLPSEPDVWRKSPSTNIRPGVLMQFDLRDPRIPTAASIESIDLTVKANGTGGVELNYWKPTVGGWWTVDANDGTSVSPLSTTLTGTTAEAALTVDRSFHVLLRGVTPLASRPTTSVQFDDVEVTVTYRP